MITIDWGTSIIHIQKSDMILVQSSPTEIRELNLDTFRLTLKNLEDDEDGISFPKTHNHNPVVTVSGVQLARVIEILEPYTITFEDGQYAVNLVGANSNVADRVNVNQVSVRSANSAGLVQTREIEYSSFGGAVNVDVQNVTGKAISGTGYPSGTKAAPVNNMIDAKFIADLRGFRTIYLMSDSTLSSCCMFDNFVIEGANKLTCRATVESGASVNNCFFRNLTVQGTLDNNAFLFDCVLNNITYTEGDIHECEIQGVLTIGGTAGLEIWNCYSGRQGISNPAVIDMGGGGRNCAIHNWSGHIKVVNMSTYGVLGISTSGSGSIKIENTVTAGLVHIMGNFKLNDQHGGTAVVKTDYVTSPAGIATKIITDELMTTMSANIEAILNFFKAYSEEGVNKIGFWTDETKTAYIGKWVLDPNNPKKRSWSIAAF